MGFSLCNEKENPRKMHFKLLEMSTLIEMDFLPLESGSEQLIIHAEHDVLELDRSIYVWSDKYYLPYPPARYFSERHFCPRVR